MAARTKALNCFDCQEALYDAAGNRLNYTRSKYCKKCYNIRHTERLKKYETDPQFGHSQVWLSLPIRRNA